MIGARVVRFTDFRPCGSRRLLTRDGYILRFEFPLIASPQKCFRWIALNIHGSTVTKNVSHLLFSEISFPDFASTLGNPNDKVAMAIQKPNDSDNPSFSAYFSERDGNHLLVGTRFGDGLWEIILFL
jgi:hypothetical protein